MKHTETEELPKCLKEVHDDWSGLRDGPGRFGGPPAGMASQRDSVARL